MPGPDPRVIDVRTFARRLAVSGLAVLALLVLAALRVSAARRVCVSSAPFTEATGGRVAASADPDCNHRGDVLACDPHATSLAATTVTLEGLRDPRAPEGPGSESHVTLFRADPGPLAFTGLGGPARLTLEVEATDVPPGFGTDVLRALVACEAVAFPPPPALPAP